MGEGNVQCDPVFSSTMLNFPQIDKKTYCIWPALGKINKAPDKANNTRNDHNIVSSVDESESEEWLFQDPGVRSSSNWKYYQ